MGISCGAALIKYLLFFFNLLWLALGATILYFGIKTISFSGDLESIVDNSIKTGAIVVIVAGSVIFLIAFLGCWGACRESSCMLATYGGIILILVIVQCVGAYFAFHYKDKIEGDIGNELQDKLKTYKDNQKIREAIQNLQKQLKCCGIKSSKDYFENSIYPQDVWPASCCDKSFENNSSATCEGNGNLKFEEGCIHSFVSALKGLGFVAISLVLVQLLIVVSACCLAREVRS